MRTHKIERNDINIVDLDDLSQPWDDVEDDVWDPEPYAATARKTQRKRSGISPVALFFITLFLIVGLGTGALFLYRNFCLDGNIAAAEKNNIEMEKLSETIEEPIPVEPVAEESKDPDADAENSPEEAAVTDGENGMIDLATCSPTASENIVKTESGIYALTSTGTEDSVTLAFAGDILFDSYYATGASIYQRGSIEACFDETTLEIMRSADIFMLNNEFPYSDRGTPIADKMYTFRAAPSSAAWLSSIGVDIVSLANNHAYDYGEEALLDTVDTLDGISMIHVGAGRNLAEAEEPAYFYINGMTVAILNGTQIERLDNPDTKGATETGAGVFRCWDDTELLSVIREAKTKADYIIVYIHWGTEKMSTADESQRKCQQDLAEAGVDLVIGDHPHVLQPISRIGNMVTIYSLGNFLFTSYDTDTGIFEVTLRPSDKTVTSMQFIPMQQTNCSVRTLTGSEKTRVLDEIRSGSNGISIDEDGYVLTGN